MTTTTAAAASTTANADSGGQQLQLQLPMPTEEDGHQQTALLRITTSKQEGRCTRCACNVFIFYFLLTSYYRRRGIPSISMPGAPSPLVHSCFDATTLPSPQSPPF